MPVLAGPEKIAPVAVVAGSGTGPWTNIGTNSANLTINPVNPSDTGEILSCDRVGVTWCYLPASIFLPVSGSLALFHLLHLRLQAGTKTIFVRVYP